MADLPNTQWWLASLDQYGNAKLCDGPHGDRSGVEQAMYLFRSLGLERAAGGYAAAEVRLTAVEPKAHGANEDAIATLNSTRRADTPETEG